MAIDEGTLRKELNTFGLSDKEIETYLAVLSCGEATATAIVDEAEVSKRYVYSIAERLSERGLVEVNNHASPTTIRARPPAEAISQMSERLQSLTPSLEDRYVQTERQTTQFQTVKSRQTAIKHLRELITGATEEIILCLPLAIQEKFKHELIRAVNRDILVVGLFSDAEPDQIDPSCFNSRATVVRTWSESGPFMAVADNHDAIVGDAGLLSGTHQDETAVRLSQGHLAGSILGSVIGSFWPIADEAYVARPGELPRQFDAFRHAVVEAVLHHQQGTDLIVEVKTEEGTELSGPLVDIRQCIVRPETGTFPVENGLIVELESGDTVSIGGPGAFVEDHSAETVTVRKA